VNQVFIAIVAIACVFAAITSLTGWGDGDMATVSQAALDGAKASVTLAIGLMGYMALFLGLTKVAEEGGLLKLLARAIRPIMVRLFPDVPPDHPAMGAMILNIAANMLGLGNAATPLGIKAMQELNRLNPHKGTASNAMVLFLAINTSGLALLPTGVVGVRAAMGSEDPWGILVTTLAATGCATIVGILVAKGLQRLRAFRLPDVPTPDPDAPEEAAADSAVVKELMEHGKSEPDSIGVWVMRGFLVLSMAFLAAPPILSAALPSDLPTVSEIADAEIVAVYDVIALKAESEDDAAADAPAGTWTLVAPDGSRTEIVDNNRLEPDTAGVYTLSCVDDAGATCGSRVLEAYPSTPARLRRLSKETGAWVIPMLILSLLGYGFFRKIKVYEAFVRGAKEGFQTGVMIIPYLVAILVSVGMLRASGGLTMVIDKLSVITEPLGIPSEILPMAMVRPLSGSGAFGLMAELTQTHGPDSYIGYMATTLQGSTDTTFYVLAVYFGAVGVSRTRHAVWAGLSADFAGFVAAVIVCRVLFGHLMGM
jgi:spore maturation protein SpmA